MNKEIDTIRRSIDKVVRMLAGHKVTVTTQGVTAFVKYNQKGEPTHVNIPYLPDNASRGLIKAVQGFLDHEVAHILFTDHLALKTARDSKPLLMMTNIIEDCRIERRMSREFAGSESNLEAVRSWVIEDDLKPLHAKTMAKADATEVDHWKNLLVQVFRAWSGQKASMDFMADGDKYALMPTIIPKIEFAKERMRKLASSADARKLAQDIVKALSEDDKPAEEDKSEDKGNKDKKEKSKGGKKSDKSDKSDKSKKPSSKSNEEEGDESPEYRDADDADADEDDTDEGEDDSEGDADNEVDGDAGEGGQDGEDDSSGDAEGEVEADEAGGDSDSEDQGQPLDVTAVINAISEAPSDQDSLGNSIKKILIKGHARGKWNIFSDEMSSIDPVDKSVLSGRDGDFIRNAMEEKTRTAIGPLSRTLERILMSKNRAHWEGGLRRGRLNPSSLHRVMAGDDRVFRRKQETRAKNTAVEILIDISGSMWDGGRSTKLPSGKGCYVNGSRRETAIYSAFGLAQGLERCRIPTEVLAFTTRSAKTQRERDMIMAMRQEQMNNKGVSYSLNEINAMPMLKGRNERVSNDVRDRFAALAYDYDLGSSNCDPLAVEVALRRLAASTEERKVLIVLSDGQPAFSGDCAAGAERLKEIVKDADKQGIQVLGIGIQSSAVSEYYPRHFIINEVSELPEALIKQAKELLG